MAGQELLRARQVGVQRMALAVSSVKEDVGGGDKEYLRRRESALERSSGSRKKGGRRT